MGSICVDVRIPEDLLEKADIVAKVRDKDRTEIMTEALREYVDEIEGHDSFKEDVIELYLDDEIGIGALKEFLGPQVAESVRSSKELLDDGESLVDSLGDLE